MRLGSGVAMAVAGVAAVAAAVALIGPLAWELPYAMGSSLKRQKIIIIIYN